MEPMKHLRPIPVLALVALACGCKFIAGQLIAFVDRYDNGVPKREGTLADGVQSGEWVYYYENGQRRAAGRYEDDHQVGPWTYYYEGGNVEWTGGFDENGKRTGAWTFYYPNGVVRAEGSFAADFEEGAWRFYSDEGQPQREGSFDAGMLSGPWTYYDAAGAPKAQGVCHRGQRVGAWTLWKDGEAVAQQYPLRGGLQVVREQWGDGAIRRVGLLQNGEPVGRWNSYHRSGELRFGCSFRGGQPAGLFEARREDGSLLAVGCLNGSEFAEGCVANPGNGPRPITAGPMPQRPPATDEWSAADIVATQPVETVVATWLQEARVPVEQELLAAAPAAELAPASAEVVAEVEAEVEAAPERIAAPQQPSWTVLQQKELDDYVLNYLEGPSRRRMSARSYGPSSSRGRTSGPGRRESLEGKPIPERVFEAADGTTLDLDDLVGKKRVLLVILRGYVGEVCVYCVAQTEALAQCKDDFEALDLEVVVVYPGAEGNEIAFKKAYEQTFGRGGPPYKVYFDSDFELVNKLGIAGDLAFPTTLITDKQGIVEYAFVGAHRADRPAAKKLLDLIEEMKK